MHVHCSTNTPLTCICSMVVYVRYQVVTYMCIFMFCMAILTHMCICSMAKYYEQYPRVYNNLDNMYMWYGLPTHTYYSCELFPIPVTYI